MCPVVELPGARGVRTCRELAEDFPDQSDRARIGQRRCNQLHLTRRRPSPITEVDGIDALYMCWLNSDGPSHGGRDSADHHTE